MSLILTFKTDKFGVVYSDGRVTLMRHGEPVGPAGETAQKFRVLRPDMVIAGSSNISMDFDVGVYERLQDLASNLSEDCSKNFRTIMECIPHIIVHLLQSHPAECGAAKRIANFHLVGFDREHGLMRNVLYALEGSNWKMVETKASISGRFETTDHWTDKLIAEVGEDDPTPEVALRAMARMADKLAAQHPEVIGPPYSYCVVKPSEVLA